MTDVILSVILITYNHSKYIDQCIKSILEQSIIENIKVIWVDDCSTDDTVEVGERAFRSVGFSRVERVHFFKNRHQRRISFLLDAVELINSEFFAIIDGDDHLIDTRKYETQVGLMRQTNEIGISFTRSHEIDEAGILTGKIWGDLGPSPGIVSFPQVIEGDGGLMPTSSLVLRTSKFQDPPNWFWEYQPVGDYMFQVLASEPLGALYLPLITSAYRTQVPHSWTSRTMSNRRSKVVFHREFIRLLFQMREYFDVGFNPNFDKIIDSHIKMLLDTMDGAEDRRRLRHMLVGLDL